NDPAAWWQVDLGSSKAVAVVEIYNLPGSRLGRFRDITIKVLAEDGHTVVAASPLLNPGNSLGGGEADWWLGPMRLEHNFRRSATGPVAGRFVRVERTACAVPGSDNDQMVLTLAEVQVFEERIASESEPVSGGRQ